MIKAAENVTEHRRKKDTKNHSPTGLAGTRTQVAWKLMIKTKSSREAMGLQAVQRLGGILAREAPAEARALHHADFRLRGLCPAATHPSTPQVPLRPQAGRTTVERDLHQQDLSDGIRAMPRRLLAVIPVHVDNGLVVRNELSCMLRSPPGPISRTLSESSLATQIAQRINTGRCSREFSATCAQRQTLAYTTRRRRWACLSDSRMLTSRTTRSQGDLSRDGLSNLPGA